MPAYKRQHWLPAVYLKNFSHESELGRRAFLWRYDGNTMMKVAVESQCEGNFFYSKEQPEATEKRFWQSEAAYENCVKLIREKKPSSAVDYFSLIFTIFDFHARNAIYANNTGKEGVYAYE